MATTFHRFPDLPWELRARIWELSAEHRVVHVGTKGYGKNKALFSVTPIPAMLQACRESRNLGVYRQYFSWRGYVWLNLDLDIIDNGMQDLRDLKLVAPSIKRLRLERSFVYDGGNSLSLFENLKEVYIVCPNEGSLGLCALSWKFYQGPLDKKDVILLDQVNDRMTTLFEWTREAEERFEPHREEWEAIVRESGSELSSHELQGRYSMLPIIYALDGQNGGEERLPYYLGIHTT